MKLSRMFGALMLVAIAAATFALPEIAAAATLVGNHLPAGLEPLMFIAPALAPALKDHPELQSLADALTEATDEVKNLAEDINKKYAAGNVLSAEAKEKADKALTAMGELGAQIAAMEQLLAKAQANDNGGSRAPMTAGEILVAAEGFAEYANRRGRAGKFTVDVGRIGAELSSATTAGVLVQEQRIPGIIGLPQRRLTVRGLLMPGRTNSNTIEFTRELGFTNNAGIQTEGALKGESNITFEDDTASVVTIAHWLRATKQILSDAPQLQSFVDGRLRYGLDLKEEQQLLNGTGTGGQIEGLITAATAYSAPFAISGATMIDKIRLALLQAALAEYPSDGVVLNPIDWARVETTKDSEGRYIIGNPQGTLAPTLWGVPVVPTQSMTVDKFLAGAFGMAAQIFDREDSSVQISDEDGDNFVKNKVTILAEKRLAMVVNRPEAFIYGDFGNV